MALPQPTTRPDLQYTTVGGYFAQDDMATDYLTFDYSTTNFGLLNRPYETDDAYDPERKRTQWERFQHHVSQLKSQCEPGIQYKVLYLARHGQGHHNVAEGFYGTPEWNRYWARLPGDGTAYWVDAHLTPTGVAQAQVAHEFWKNAIQTQHTPVPQSYYVSPLYRCLQTAKITFDGLDLPPQHPFVPVIKELLREVLGVHTCDQRSSKTYIQEHFPEFVFEPGFAEADELWKPDYRETDSELDARLKMLLDDIFRNDQNTFLSFTAHSGAINSILRVVGHRTFRIPTGAVIPVLVKAQHTP